MTIHGGGSPIFMSQINDEFGRGTNLNAYRGVQWYTDAGGSGTFSGGTISMYEFYDKRATSPHHPFGFNNFNGSPTRTNGDLTVSGYGIALTDYAGGRGPNYFVDFQIDAVGCVVGLCNGVPASYPADASTLGLSLRQDGTLFFNVGGGPSSIPYTGFNNGDVISFIFAGDGYFYIAYNGGAPNLISNFPGGYYPCVLVEGGQVTLRTSSSFGYTNYWYP